MDPRVEFDRPTTAKPQTPAPPSATPTGGIYQDSMAYRPLFEDKRARYIGDTVTIIISESISASQKTDTSAERTGSLNTSVTALNDIPVFGGSFLRNVLGLTAKESNAQKHDGKGSTDNNNTMTGTITCTVVDVLQNGNLVVAGEKQIGTNHEVETVKFSGVVNPSTILSGNRVSSTQVADARLEYRGKGQVDSAQAMGWLSRFFLSFLPF
ncbi:MAG: flagellar basal body L-ring protein FlgH [Burkholderiaceae bacterium]|nr:MAG: flagellar basal body L-ring protein FlgH [Burkholderiaceae bacterium]